MTVRVVTQVTYYPDGCDPDDPEAGQFAVHVVRLSGGAYVVHDRVRSRWLSTAGRWSAVWGPLPAHRRHYLHTEEVAHRLACTTPAPGVNGWSSWAEFAAWRESKRAERAEREKRA